MYRGQEDVVLLLISFLLFDHISAVARPLAIDKSNDALVLQELLARRSLDWIHLQQCLDY